MGEITGISWCHHTFNCWWGCVKVSEECRNCYAEGVAKRFGQDVWGVNRPRHTFGPKHWNEPLKWNRDAEKARERRRVFCGSMMDVFEVNRIQGLDAEREKLWELIAKTPALDWLLLTKRPENIGALVPWKDSWPENVWLGTTAGTQKSADQNLPMLLSFPAIVRFVSMEPLLEGVDIRGALNGYPVQISGREYVSHEMALDAGIPEMEGSLYSEAEWQQTFAPLDWVIVGGESGPGCRPMEIEWARDLRTQCREINIPFFMKQLGGHPDKKHDLADFPEDLRVREFPND